MATVWSLFLSGTQLSLKPASQGGCVQRLTGPSTLHTHQGSLWGLGEWFTLTPEAKMAGFPLSSMSSSSSLVVVRPAASRGHTEPCTPHAGFSPTPTPHPGPPQLTDLQLPLDAALAALTVVRLCGIVLGHDLHKLAGQRGVLGVRDGVQVSGPAPEPQGSSARQPTPEARQQHLCLSDP